MNQMKKYQQKKKTNVVVTDSNDDLKTFVILIVAIVCILGVVYLVAVLFEKKDYSNIFDNSLETSEIQFDEIIVGTMLKQNEDSYYVLVLDEDDPYYSILSNYLTSYRSLEYETKIYSVELNNIFNKTAKVETSDISNLKFSGTTLVKVENHQIKKSYTDSFEIGNILLSMTKELEDAEEE
jgi:hypothetical protein